MYRNEKTYGSPSNIPKLDFHKETLLLIELSTNYVKKETLSSDRKGGNTACIFSMNTTAIKHT